MNSHFADLFAQLNNISADCQTNGGQEVIELTHFEIAAVGGGEAITNVY